ncbi:hypothetical protein [Spirillospora sp. NPDC047279]|uniref:hypothetical protein n=1 Tax=Spirillospora sp. NPDC047279 TaxID=3155478 RepID=UPI0034004DCA
MWIAAAAGWGVIAGGLRRGLSGHPRRIALVAHGLTPAGLVLVPSMLGFGHLYASIGAAAEWWALAAVTGFRPERLVVSGGPRRLAAWSVLAAAIALVTARFVL